MFTIGSSGKLYIPVFDQDSFIELGNPMLNQYDVGWQNRSEDVFGRSTSYPRFDCLDVNLSFTVSSVNMVEGKKEIFKLLTDNLTIKEALTIVENKLKQRKEK